MSANDTDLTRDPKAADETDDSEGHRFAGPHAAPSDETDDSEGHRLAGPH